MKGGFQNSGIHVAANKTLTIQGSGTLNATGGIYAAGIGSGYNNSSCGNITISGGIVTATGGDRAPGIGSGHYQSSCGNITITNGVTRVTATKGSSSPNAIGAGNGSTCGTVTIGDVQTGFITLSPFVTYPYTVSFDANGGTGTMANMNFMYNVARNLTYNSFINWGCLFDGWATSATGPKVYNDGQSVSNLAQNSGDTVTLYAKWNMNISVDGDEYTIHTPTGWDMFCDLIAENSNGYFTGKTVKLDADISVTRMAGSSGHEFSGTFDGQEHTLTVNYENNDSDIRTAPFSYVNGATIQNLIVAGDITGTAPRAAGIVGETGNSLSHVTNCVSSVNVSGGQYTGGISIGGNVEITGCVFNGTIVGADCSGGFVGCSNSALVISNCLFAPQNGSAINGGTFYYNGGGDITPVNSYYTVSFGTSQGKQARSIVAGENVTVAFSGQATTYNVSGIIAYSVGMVYNNTCYAGEGDAVSLNLGCTIPDGYTFLGYQASAGILTGSTNPYTLTMPDADVTLQAVLRLDFIHYMDADSVLHTRSDFTVLTGDETTLDAGWYVVDHDITYDSTLTLNGDVTLILRNGKTMTVSPNSGIGIMGEDALTIYGQSLDTDVAGSLNVIAGDDIHNSIIMPTYSQHTGKVVVGSLGDVAFCAGNCTIHGGSIEVSGIIANNNLTINSGSFEASRVSTGITANNNLTINGGKVEASHIWAGQNIILGWTNTDDYIRADSYEVGNGTISVKSGQAFYCEEDENIIVSGTLNSSQINAIGGKTLRPRFVNYMDGNGGEHICKNFTLLTGTETTLDAGWYVVDHDITYDSTLFLNGDVTLILCNGKTMTVAPQSQNKSGIWDELITAGTLTIYGQSLDLNEVGALNVITNDGFYAAIWLGSYTQHSGKVVVSNFGDAIKVSDMTINGGSIYANGSGYGILAGSGDVTINGGKVEASSIFAYSNITLGWTRTDDYIRAGSYGAGGTLSVKSGQAFYYNINVIVSGTLNWDQINAIDGKTLRPYPLATYTLTPTSYTLTNSGYTDITCTLSSLELLEVWDGNSLVQATSLSFYMHGGTLTDTIGHSIPFLVDNGSHSGAAAQMAQGDEFSSGGATFIMAVYIDSVAYATAAPGTYTGEFVYDSYWNSADKSLPSIPGASGSIALTLVIPEPSTVTQTIALAVGTNWFSTNLEITLADLQTALRTALPSAANRSIKIMSQNSGYSQNFGNNWNGQLRTLDVAQMYMIIVPEACEITLEGMPVDPAEHPVTIVNGSNWIGFPLQEGMTLNNAFAGFGTTGDVVKSQTNGQATKRGNSWMGQLKNLVPGQGYIYNATANGVLTFPVSAK
ncbi:MAG: InlB B-repeat-containing protein [Muribaculaceae bacterium]|nr:InlB B-repeat-containing protein [Muribaculaceae bacterium]